jgi:chromosome segregation ATPase
MEIQIGTVEALAAILGPLAAAAALAIRSAVRQLEQSANDLRLRVDELESKLDDREKRIEKLESDLETTMAQLRDLQQWKTLAQDEIEDKNRKIKDLTAERDACKYQAEQAFESAKQWQLRHDTLAEVLRKAVVTANANESNEDSTKSATVADSGYEKKTDEKPKEAEK